MNVNLALALIALGACLGVMVYFAASLAPRVFRSLPAEHAGPFIRAQFRSYYAFLAVLSAFAAVIVAETRPLPSGFAAVAAAGFLLLRQILMPQMDEARAQRDADDPAAELRFQRLHRLSVTINALQLAALVAAAALLAFGG